MAKDEAQKPADAAPAEAPQQPEDVVVTLEHPSFGSYTFRSQESRITSTVTTAIARARKEFNVRTQVAEIDQKQHDLQPAITEARGRVEAARTLKDTAAEAREQRAADALQKQVDDLAAQRQKALDTLVE